MPAPQKEFRLVKRTIPKARQMAEATWEETEDTHKLKLLWSTGHKGLRQEWFEDEPYYEELEMSEEACDLSRLKSGAPVLVQHENHVPSVIGVCEDAWIEGGMGYALIRLSKREDVAGLVGDVLDGILRNVSVGYRVDEYTEIEPTDGVKTLLATKWTPEEISIVAVGFDPQAQVLRQSSEKNDVQLKLKTQSAEEPMPLKKKREEVTPEDIDNIDAAAEEAEEARKKGIKDAVAAAGLGEEFAQELIDKGVPLEEATDLIFQKLDEQNTEAEESDEEERSMNLKKCAQRALLNRIDAKKFKLERSNPFKGAPMIKMLEAFTERKMGESDSAFVKRATVTGDLQALLENVANKLVGSEGAEKFTYHRFARQQTLKDFRDTPIVQLSGVDLASKTEGEDYQAATLKDSSEKMTLEERGILIQISQKAVINDDLGLLKLLPTRGAQAGHRDLEKRMYALLALNGGLGPKLSNDKELFNDAHNNRITDGLPPTPDGVRAANEVMALHQDDSSEPLDLRTKVIVCGTDLEMIAKQTASSQLVPNKAGNVNPYAGELEVAVSSRVPAGVWYALADKEEWAALVYGTLEGMDAPNVETETDFNSSNIKTKIEFPNCVAAASAKGIVKVEVADEEEDEEEDI